MVYISEKESLSDPAAVQENNESANKEKQITFYLFIPGVYWCVALKSIDLYDQYCSRQRRICPGQSCMLFYQLRKFCQRENVVFSINICI